jgi:hypothetical protein
VIVLFKEMYGDLAVNAKIIYALQLYIAMLESTVNDYKPNCL